MVKIDWDVPIEMDDGVVLRADVFRPIAGGNYPVILSYGPYGKGLAFRDGWKNAWDRLITMHPNVIGAPQNCKRCDTALGFPKQSAGLVIVALSTK